VTVREGCFWGETGAVNRLLNRVLVLTNAYNPLWCPRGDADQRRSNRPALGCVTPAVEDLEAMRFNFHYLTVIYPNAGCGHRVLRPLSQVVQIPNRNDLASQGGFTFAFAVGTRDYSTDNQETDPQGRLDVSWRRMG
jgi:hypothetical protein